MYISCSGKSYTYCMYETGVDIESRQTHLNVLECMMIIKMINTSEILGQTGLTGCADRSNRCMQGPRVDLEQ
jgi:hypothetical protein